MTDSDLLATIIILLGKSTNYAFIGAGLIFMVKIWSQIEVILRIRSERKHLEKDCSQISPREEKGKSNEAK